MRPVIAVLVLGLVVGIAWAMWSIRQDMPVCAEKVYISDKALDHMRETFEDGGSMVAMARAKYGAQCWNGEAGMVAGEYMVIYRRVQEVAWYSIFLADEWAAIEGESARDFEHVACGGCDVAVTATWRVPTK